MLKPGSLIRSHYTRNAFVRPTSTGQFHYILTAGNYLVVATTRPEDNMPNHLGLWCMVVPTLMWIWFDDLDVGLEIVA